jgi:hypothetical protein
MKMSEMILDESKRRRSNTPMIFISIGRPLCDAQLEFKLALIQAIKGRGFEPRTVGSNLEDTDIPSVRGIEQIKRTLSRCDGAVVVAYERHLANALVTDSVGRHPGERLHVRFPTSWNQAEAAMAYHAGLPMLLICEEGILEECVLEDGVVGSIARIQISKNAVLDEVFQKRMSSWVDEVIERKRKGLGRFSVVDADELKLRDLVDLFGNLSWKAAIILIGVILAAMSTVYSVGYYAGSLPR